MVTLGILQETIRRGKDWTQTWASTKLSSSKMKVFNIFFLAGKTYFSPWRSNKSLIQWEFLWNIQYIWGFLPLSYLYHTFICLFFLTNLRPPPPGCTFPRGTSIPVWEVNWKKQVLTLSPYFKIRLKYVSGLGAIVQLVGHLSCTVDLCSVPDIQRYLKDWHSLIPDCRARWNPSTASWGAQTHLANKILLSERGCIR